MIQSKENEQIKYLNKLKLKKYRDLENKFLVFGDHLILEAKNTNSIVDIYTSNPNKGGTLVSKEIMKELNFTLTPYDILAVCHKVDLDINSNKVLVLEDVQDPDNVGVLLRSALAFGFDKVLLSNKSADVYNDKTIRASKGAFFYLDIKRVVLLEEVIKYKNDGYHVYITDVDGSSDLLLSNKALLVLGNEGQGISDEMAAISNSSLSIKTNTVESLNVNVAGSILMYEWSKI